MKANINEIELFQQLEKNPVLAFQVAGNSVLQWLLAVLIFLILYISTRLICSVIVSALATKAKESENKIDDMFVPFFESIKKSLLSLAAICLALESLQLPEIASRITRSILIFTLLLQVGFSVSQTLEYLINRWTQSRDSDPARVAAMGLLGYIGRVVVWALVLTVFLDYLGVNINGLIAGLGVGGIAVALAVQNVLGDLLGSLSIILDKPFKIGDFIIVGDMLGTVEKIGIKSTRLKSISGEQLIVSNSDLLSSRIRNFKRMYERRVVFEIGVTYQTSPETLKAIPIKIKQFVESLGDDVRFDRAHFKSFGDSALIFEIVYYVLSSDYLLYMDLQQKLNLDLITYFNTEGIEFAYPTQTLFVEKIESVG